MVIMYRKDFENMSIHEIKEIWQQDMNSYGVDGRMDLLTPWDYRMIVKEVLERIEALCDGKTGTVTDLKE